MFDIGFSELLLIAVVALVVLGPERLPKAARFAGLWVRRARAQWNSVKSELERELAAEDLKRGIDDSRHAMRELDASVRSASDDARREFDAMRTATLTTGASVLPGKEAPGDGAPDTIAALVDEQPVVEPSPPAMTPTDTRGDDVSLGR